MRKLFVPAPFLLLVIAFFGVYPATVTKSPTSEAAPATPQKATAEDPPGTINGVLTPELIPDHVAYGLFFRFLAGRQTQNQKNSLRAFFRQRPQLAGIDADALMRLADEFQEAFKAIENEEAALAATSHSRSSAMDDRFALLKERRLSLVDEKVGALPNVIGMDDAEKVRRHVMEYVKRKVKLAPPPPMPAMITAPRRIS